MLRQFFFLCCRSELVCRVKYNNTLPDIPFDPKFILYPFESNRYVYSTFSRTSCNSYCGLVLAMIGKFVSLICDFGKISIADLFNTTPHPWKEPTNMNC